jgi:hypothetical protein
MLGHLHRGSFQPALSADRGEVPSSHLAPLDFPSSVGFADIFSRKGEGGAADISDALDLHIPPPSCK